MAFLRDADREFLIKRFEEELDQTVILELFSEPAGGLFVPGMRQCATCREAELLLAEVAETSDKIELRVHNIKQDPELAAKFEVTATPTIAVHAGEDAGVRFLGLPVGYEFTSLIETIVFASKEPGAGLQPATIEKLEALEEDLELKVFSTPT